MAAHLHGLPCCRNRQEFQGARVDKPGRGRHHLAGQQRALREQPPDAWGTDSPLRRGLLARQPVVLLRNIGPARRIPHTRAPVRPPSVPGPGAIAPALQRGRHGLGATDLGECAEHLQRLLSGGTAMLPRGMPRHPHRRVPPAVPVELQQVRRGLWARVHEKRMPHRPQHTFFQRF
jgi:hypothetical protein